MNPPIRGQYMGCETYTSGLLVQRHLLARRRERPCDLQATFLAKHEPQLLGRPQPVRMVRAIRRARPWLVQRTQQVLAKEAALATCLT